MYFFVVADEVDPLTRHVTRRVFTLESHDIQRMIASQPLEAQRLMYPEKWGLQPTGPRIVLSPGQHALGTKPSPYISASDLPNGASRFFGRTIYINVAKARAGV